jgi:PmbA protein
MSEPSHDSAAEAATLEACVREVLATAAQRGASAAEASVSSESGLTVNVRLGEVETLEFQRDRGLSLTVYVGTRKGSASTADLRPESLAATVQAALDIARHTEADPAAGLADAALMPDRVPDLDLWHPWGLDAEAAIEIAQRCEAAARAEPRIHNSEGATLSTHAGVRVYGNSHGFVGSQRGTHHSLACSVLAKDAKGDMQRDYWWSAARVPGELEDAEAIGRIAAERTVRRLGATKLSTRTARVLYAPELARGLIGHLVGAARGGAQYRRASFLLDAVGQPVLPAGIHIVERPHLPRALGSTAFDAEGVATRDAALVEDGRLTRYVLDSYSARKLGLTSTGNAGGVHNLEVSSTHGDAAAMLRELGTGLLVTELMGQGVNGVTGDYSRGASGWWVEGGVPVQPVEEITIAGNVKDMLRGIVAVGSDRDLRGNVRVGSILVEHMTIAGD